MLSMYVCMQTVLRQNKILLTESMFVNAYVYAHFVM